MERFLLLSGFVLSVFCAPLPVNKEDLALANEFMFRFGYLEPVDRSQAESLVRVELAVKDVQRFGNIPQTGQLDNSTIQLMKSPRCGLPDVVPTKSRRRRRNRNIMDKHSTRARRYILGPTLGWTKQTISYFIANWSPKIGQSAMRTELQRALAAWAKYGHLRFQEVNSPDADIIVAFGTGYHGDGYPFDGPGSTLAHAFFPGEEGSMGGDIHFDDDETWKINPGEFEDGVDFFTVAVHEIGHSLGLSHSPEHNSVMNPYYKRLDSQSFSLGYDDVLAMYELYISRPAGQGNESSDEHESDEESKRRRTTTTTRRPTTERTVRTTTERLVTYVGDDETVDMHKTHDTKHGIPGTVGPQTPLPTMRPLTVTPPKGPLTTTTPSSKDTPDACDGHFDAVSFLRGELFIFKENFMWRLSSPGRIVPGYPVPIHRMFQKLPQSLQRIDAAYERGTDSNLIFFSDDKYWVFDGNEVIYNSPKSIHDYGLPQHVKKIDAIMVWDRNKKTYIFSGNEFWRFNETSRTMDPGYPKSLQLFRGVPTNMDSAMTWSDGVTYFFKNDLYWAFNNTWLKTEPFYPQEASKYWLGCRS